MVRKVGQLCQTQNDPSGLSEEMQHKTKQFFELFTIVISGGEAVLIYSIIVDVLVY